MSILPITVYGDKILRQKTQQVSAVNDELIENIRDMFETMRNARGVGLAGNQVGLKKSVFIIDLKPVEGYEKFKPVAMINPQIVEQSKETVVLEEGCLSLPSLVAEVKRPKIIKVKYLDPDENEQDIEADEYFARVILHEFDHLIGKMIPDRVAENVKNKLKEELDLIRSREVDVDYPITKG